MGLFSNPNKYIELQIKSKKLKKVLAFINILPYTYVSKLTNK